MHKLGVDSLQELHALMTRMSAAIVNADWDELMTLDTERRDMLNIAAASTFDSNSTQAKTSSTGTDQEQEKQRLTAEIIELDKNMLQSIKGARQRLMIDKHEKSAQQSAAAGYAQAQSFT